MNDNAMYAKILELQTQLAEALKCVTEAKKKAAIVIKQAEGRANSAAEARVKDACDMMQSERKMRESCEAKLVDALGQLATARAGEEVAKMALADERARRIESDGKGKPGSGWDVRVKRDSADNMIGLTLNPKGQ